MNNGWSEFCGCLIILIVFGLSWLITCGLVKLITMCFGWPFSWAVATGVWLIMFLWNIVTG